MSESTITETQGPEDRLYEAIAAFEEARDAGQDPQPREWLIRYAEVATQLSDFFTGQDLLRRLAPDWDFPAVEPETPQLPDYQILEEVGHGGMGVVYRARQVSLNRVVALKVIRGDKLADLSSPQRGEWFNRFRNEAEAVADLDHPNIIPIHEVGVYEGRPFFCMKLVEGGSLKDHLEHHVADPRASARLLATVARAVHHAHQRGILHRDLKPGNILLDPEGRPYVTDFGLVKRLEGGDTLTQDGALLGTPEYMAPEQARGEKRPSTAVDVYSLGAILYTLLTGAPPFRGETPLEIMRQLTEEEPEPPRAQNARVDRDLETICLKCLHKEPDRRYDSADALASDLESWLAGEPIQARPVGRFERVVKWIRRRPGVAALLAAVVIALTGGGSLSTYFAIQAGKRAEEARDHARTANTAREELEVTLASNLFRPIGHRPEPPGLFEAEVFWELGTIANDRVRLRFLEKALENGESASRYTRRIDLVVQAAVGLDLSRRQQARQLLLTRLRDRDHDFRVQAACLHLGIALGEDDPEFTKNAVRTLLGALDRAADSQGMLLQSRALRALAEQFDSGQAAKAVRKTLEQKARDSETRHELAEAFKTLAGKLDRDQATTIAQKLVASLDNRDARFDLRFSAAVLLALAPRLDRDQATRLVAAVAAKAGHEIPHGFYVENDDSEAGVFQALTGWLERGQAEQVAAQIGQTLVQEMAQTEQNQLFPHLAQALDLVTGRLDEIQTGRLIAQATQVLVERMERARWAVECHDFARAFHLLVRRLERDQAGKRVDRAARELARRMGQAAREVADQKDRTSDLGDLVSLALAFELLADRLDRGQADQWAASPAQVAADRMTQVDGNDLECLTLIFQALVGSLARDRAATLATKPAEVIVERMGNSTPYEFDHLVKAFAALARGLDQTQARRLALRASQVLAERMDRGPDNGWLKELVKALRILAGWLDRGDARRLAARAAEVLTERLGQATHPADLFLASGGSALAGLLEPDHASRLATQVVRAAQRIMERLPAEPMARPDEPYFLRQRTAGFIEPLVADLGQDRAVEVAARIVEQMAQTVFPGTRTPPVNDLEALAVRLEPQQLVDLLKNPFCVGPAREVILQQLGRRLNQPFTSVWDFITWAQEHEPELDLHTPPRRPER
jgi:hypothetical protein